MASTTRAPVRLPGLACLGSGALVVLLVFLVERSLFQLDHEPSSSERISSPLKFHVQTDQFHLQQQAVGETTPFLEQHHPQQENFEPSLQQAGSTEARSIPPPHQLTPQDSKVQGSLKLEVKASPNTQKISQTLPDKQNLQTKPSVQSEDTNAALAQQQQQLEQQYHAEGTTIAENSPQESAYGAASGFYSHSVSSSTASCTVSAVLSLEASATPSQTPFLSPSVLSVPTLSTSPLVTSSASSELPANLSSSVLVNKQSSLQNSSNEKANDTAVLYSTEASGESLRKTMRHMETEQLNKARHLKKPPAAADVSDVKLSPKYGAHSCRSWKSIGTLPRGMLIGCHNCGSTALFAYIVNHGDILPARCKEVHFFDSETARGSAFRHRYQWMRTDKQRLLHYAKFFPSVNSSQITFEGTPSYIRHQVTAMRIKSLLPSTKFVLLLRNPSYRFLGVFLFRLKFNKGLSCQTRLHLISSELHQACLHRTSTEERDACLDDISEQSPLWNMVIHGLYASQLRRWLAVFPASQFYILQTEALFGELNRYMNEIAAFLGVPAYSERESRIFGKHVGSSYTQRYFQYQQRYHSAAPFDCDLDALHDFFQPFNEELYELLQNTYPDRIWYRWQAGTELIPLQRR